MLWNFIGFKAANKWLDLYNYVYHKPIQPTGPNQQEPRKREIDKVEDYQYHQWYHNHHHCNACHNAREGTLGED